eukprot:TRINITY_DN6112_c1_g3_i2.p1 TRINITY_DN6112_c1_g3~~TRINITY_DN6112_c1_g3_i2.p1  ORF type:complete len:590 (+),score=142.74 TRINITY_DN6112_c1_g3_i2:1964-3733(+)
MLPLANMPRKVKVLAIVVLIWLVRYLKRRAREKAKHKLLLKGALKKRVERDERRKQFNFKFELIPDGLTIINMTVHELLDAMEKRTLTSEQIVTAYSARALQAGLELDCNAEEMYLEAIEEARKCDEERNAGTLRGPLHGIPISVKDQYHMEGLVSTCGLACRATTKLTYTSVLVKALRDQGAIPFVRSNVPQALMLPESFNAIWGTAKNPYNVARTPGGSSGGEGALIACGASPLGLGTDIGGSIRIPAGFCGVVGFKPTAQRVSSHGVGVPRPGDSSGQNAVFGNAGPLARSVDDVELVMRLWCTPAVWSADPAMAPMPWDAPAAMPRKSMTFGVLFYDGFFKPAPSYTRALNLVVEGLKKEGHEVKPITFDLSRHAELYLGLMGAEGGMQGFVDGLEGEELHENYSFVHMVASLPSAVRSVLQLFSSRREKRLLEAGKTKTTYEFWEWIKMRDNLRTSYMQYLKEEGIEAVLCPGVGLPALNHGASSKLSMSCSYTFLWNNFHFPAGSVPVTHVQDTETTYPVTYKDNLDTAAASDLKNATGLPINVQVVSLPYRDETCIAAMKVVERVARQHWTPPTFKPSTSRL